VPNSFEHLVESRSGTPKPAGPTGKWHWC